MLNACIRFAAHRLRRAYGKARKRHLEEQECSARKGRLAEQSELFGPEDDSQKHVLKKSARAPVVVFLEHARCKHTLF